MMKNYLMSEVNVLWIACINRSTKLNIYSIVRSMEFFYRIESVIIYIESPIIKHTKVVTLLASEEKKLTLGNRQIPSNA